MRGLLCDLNFDRGGGVLWIQTHEPAVVLGAALTVADGGVDVVGGAGGEGAVVGDVAFVVEVAEGVHGGGAGDHFVSVGAARGRAVGSCALGWSVA